MLVLIIIADVTDKKRMQGMIVLIRPFLAFQRCFWTRVFRERETLQMGFNQFAVLALLLHPFHFSHFIFVLKELNRRRSHNTR